MVSTSKLVLGIAVGPVVAAPAMADAQPSTVTRGDTHRQAISVAPARFTLTIDTSGASVVLAAALADPAHASQAADAALGNAAVRAMIAKMAKYDRTVTADAFKRAVVSLANGGSGAPFDLDRLRADPEPTRRMLARLGRDQAAVASRIADRLQTFAPDGLDIHARMFILVGASHQNGWVPDPSKPDFYLDLGFHGEEVESVARSASHELFHVVQGMVQPNLNSMIADRPDLPIKERELHRARAVLLNLVIEGMATYVGDPMMFTASGPHLEHDQQEVTKQLARSSEIFALFETVLFRAGHDPDAPLDHLLDIGFGGPWGETGYYVGYRMAKTIDHYSGRARLRALTSLPPEQFVADYIALSRAHPNDPEITPLTAASIATVESLKAEVESSK